MLPSLLITFREVLEAALIIATILGILTKLGHTKSVKTVWIATGAAIFVSILLLLTGSILGFKVQELFEDKEALFEGAVMMISAFFITWAVFFLHKTFAHHKLALLQKVRTTLETQEQRGIFFLVFTAVFREGLEIVLFLSTIFFSSRPWQIASGFVAGSFLAVVISASLFTATMKLPVYKTFRLTSILLIFFAAGLLSQGYHELAEVHVLPQLTNLPTLTLSFLPGVNSLLGSAIQSIFGLHQTMHSIELLLWTSYAWSMWYVIAIRKK